MDDYTLVEYRPGRWVKVDSQTGDFLGPANPQEVRAWQRERETSTEDSAANAGMKGGTLIHEAAIPQRKATIAIDGQLAPEKKEEGTPVPQQPDPEGEASTPEPVQPTPEPIQPTPKKEESAPAPQQPAPKAEGAGQVGKTGPAFPLPLRARITSTFADHKGRTPPSQAPGVDFGCGVGTEVRAWAKGKVVRSRWSQGGGRSLWIQHGGGIKTYYAHLNCAYVLEGENVKSGQKIGETGNTGRTTGPHLHFSVVRKGTYVDPEKFLVFEEAPKV
jgi:murein DD-endopeptidase MepM/ murein hydrolase activator NlpD